MQPICFNLIVRQNDNRTCDFEGRGHHAWFELIPSELGCDVNRNSLEPCCRRVRYGWPLNSLFRTFHWTELIAQASLTLLR